MLLLEIVATGVVATALADGWQQLQRPLTSISPANWAITGRWVLGFRHGRLVDHGIAGRAPIAGEAAAGWLFHYVIGIAYAALYLGYHVLTATPPSLSSGIVFGVLTTAAPFLLMKPAMGSGLFGLRVANPWPGLFLTTTTHIVFGAGLYAGAMLARSLS